MDVSPSENITPRDEGDEMAADEEEGETGSSPGAPADGSYSSAEGIPVTDSPPLSAQVPFSPRLSAQHSAPDTSFDRNCEQSQAPVVCRTQYGALTRHH